MSIDELLEALEQAKKDGNEGLVYQIEEIISARS